MLEIVCFLLCLAVFLHLYYRYCREGRLLARINGPKGIFLFGNMLDMYISPEKLFLQLREWRRAYGKIWKFYGFYFRVIHLYRPEDIEVILSSTRHIEKDLPYTFLYPWLGQGLLVSNGEKWHSRRKMLTPAFHFNILLKFIKIFNENTDDLLKRLNQEVDKDNTDVIPLTTKTSLKILCETSMGSKISCDSPSVNKYLKDVHTYGIGAIQRLCRAWLFVEPLYLVSSLSRSLKAKGRELQEFTKPIIKRMRECRNIENDVHNETYGKKSKLAMLELLFDEQAKGNIDDDGIQEEVDTFLFEGHDTTATALCFMIMRIANEPEIQDLIFQELQTIYGDSQRSATYEELTKMKYLECCIKESLRLYPSVPFINRYVTQEIVLGGQTMPKNVLFDIHAWDTHRDPEIYPDPEKFIPERFLPENMAKRHPYAYIPFSAGPRNCIGQKFALLELKAVMSGLLRRYRLEPVTRPQDLVFSADLVLRTNHPIYVRFCHRT